MFLGFRVALAAVAATAYAGLAPTAPLAQVSNLGVLGADIASEARGVNFDGTVVVGVSRPGGGADDRAFRWAAAAGMQSIGSFGGISWATAVSANGTVVVGYSAALPGPSNPAHAFRWTEVGGMQDLGTLGGRESMSYGVSSDGSVVVGWSNLPTGDLRAFRWTSAGGLQSLGSMPGPQSCEGLATCESQALGISSDGRVIVGSAMISDAGSLRRKAFRWTAAEGMSDLGTVLPGGRSATARAANVDGTVIVGNSDDGVKNRAFRWTAMGGMQDLGGASSDASATGVDHSGNVVVGLQRAVGASDDRAFRWTAKTGLVDLSTLLSRSGVNMTGITLGEGGSHVAVSGNGQFIVGQGSFSGARRAFIVRYFDPIPGEVGNEDGKATARDPLPNAIAVGTIAGVTNSDSVQSSINQLAFARQAAGVHQHGFAAPLLGADKPFAHTNEIGAFGSAGSLATGAAARYVVGESFAIFGGLSYSQEDYPNLELRHATTGALALRYLPSGFGAWQPFIEVGGWVSPNTSMRFTRTYANGAGFASGIGSADGTMTYGFGRAGMVVDLDRGAQLAVSGEYGRE